ncbi:MAG TPA: OB-fold nucleic acid binding domain-containing protein, partial [Roseomonas sp.]
AGYSLGGADLLRRAMGKKIRSEMQAQRAIFVEGATGRGIPEDKAGEIFDMMERFAEYGFNKSHAAAYALISYQTAWLKANYPVAFLAASMTLDMANTDKLASHLAEAARLGIKVLPPDVNASDAEFAVEEREAEDGTKTQAIRFALAAVKRVGFGAMQDLVKARKEGGPFKSLSDFADRVDPKLLNKMQVENLARAGAFESLDPNRARVTEGAELILRRAQAAAGDRGSAQIGLFGAPGASADTPPLRLRDMPDWPQLDRLSQEAEAIGFHLSAHPLDAYREVLRKLNVCPIAKMTERAQAGAARLRLAGTVIGTKERTTKTGSRMAWIRISDASGSTEVTCFSEVLGKCREMLTEGNAVMFSSEVRVDGEAVRLTAMDCEPLERAAQSIGQGLRIEIAAMEALDPLRNLLEREGKGRGEVIIIPRTGPGQEVELTLPGRWNVSPRLAQALKVIPGVEAVEAA